MCACSECVMDMCVCVRVCSLFRWSFFAIIACAGNKYTACEKKCASVGTTWRGGTLAGVLYNPLQ